MQEGRTEEPSRFDKRYRVLREWRQRRSSEEQLVFQLVEERQTGAIRVELRLFERDGTEWWPTHRGFWLSKKEVRSICRMVAKGDRDGQDEEDDQGADP